MPPPPPALGAVMVMPELLPRSKLLVAVNVAPPENTSRLTPAHDIVGEPLATETVACVLNESELTAIWFDDEPVQVKALVTAVVTPLGKVIALGAVTANVATVFAPLKVNPPPELLAETVIEL